jgi:transcriptional regulator with PAS, ATPase and Fis domain
VDPQVKRLYENLALVAASSLTVLVLGETGVGKELAAEAVHRLSPRSAGPLVKINCASLPESLLESELFGYERGAFTGAARRKQGYFEAAHHGTLFLDEIGEMPLGLQAKLLRVLERRAIIRVGATAEVEVDVRIVAATNRDLEGEVARGAFREDLYYRVSGFTVMVPPLRDRPGEIVPLAQRFLRGFAAELGQAAPELSEAAVRALQAHSWPGNVRELRNTMERALALHTAGVIEVSHLSDRVREGARAPRAAPPSAAVVADLGSQVAALERSAIAAALESCGGNQTQAARVLGITRRALLYKLDKLGLRDGASR